VTMLWKIALRNIMRHKRRTIFSGITIAFGMLFYIFIDSVMAGLDRGAIDNMIELSTAAIKIQTPRYLEDQKALPLKHGVENGDAVRRSLASEKRVRGITPRAGFLGQLSIYTETTPVMGTVIDPRTDSTVFSLHDYVEGSYFSDRSDREILIGNRLARELGLKTGDWVTLYALTRYDSRNADDFRVAGLINSTDPVQNNAVVYITYQAANGFLDLEDLATELDVGLHRRTNLGDFKNDVSMIQQRLQAQFPDLRIQSFMELAASFLEIAKTKRAFGAVFLLVVMLIASIGIFNTVLMSVYERIREVGVMRAFGFTAGEMARLFMLEGLMTGMFGAVMGIALGVAGNIVLVTYGYPVDKIMGDDMGGFPVWGTIYGEWNIATYVTIFVLCVLIATFAGLIPARKAGRMEITQTLRFV